MKKSTITNTILSIIVVIAFIILLEIISFFLLPKQDFVPSPVHATQFDSNLGYVLTPNTSHHALKAHPNGSLSYNVTYTTDSYGRRSILQTPNRTHHLLLFGGSVTFGEGLADSQTLAYYLSQELKSYHAYTYAVQGYGPSHLLAQLESNTILSEIDSSSGLALYVFIPAHVHRATGSSLATWIYDSPYYVLENDQVIRRGSFRSDRSLLTGLYEGFTVVKSKSSFLQLANVNLPLWSSKSDIDLTTAIIHRSKEIYESQFSGEFYVVFHPEWNRTKDKRGYAEFQKQFDELGIPYFDYSDYHYSDDKVLPFDQHPKGILNKEIATLIASDLGDELN